MRIIIINTVNDKLIEVVLKSGHRKTASPELRLDRMSKY